MTADYAPEYGPVRPGDELDWDRLAGYLSSKMDGLGEFVAAQQFPNGAANLTYLLEFANRRLVIRRPPFGELAIGAHDMKREFRALSRLWRCYDRAPRAYLLCEDHAVAGADFLVIEYRAGQVVWGSIPSSMAGYKDVARRIGLAVVDALADLHMLDPDRAGVADLGRPDGFVDRQLTGWQQRWRAVAPALLPMMETEPSADVIAEVSAELAATKPATTRTSVLHNDFKIDNCQFDPADPDRVHSVFDWDMATIGDPLVDLGIMLNYWPDPGDDPDNRPSHPVGQEDMGLPARAEVIARYIGRTGADVASVSWYEAFGSWKTAIVIAQLYHRYLQGDSHDVRQGLKGDRIMQLARRAQLILSNRGPS
ncbi:MAG TPA: phosphotransferase family protein [Streptosporangiaceae bacterium]|nr:phosphotransferase family protein [Streptosporangiaceae bacterium]